jgi:hypothetical protein
VARGRWRKGESGNPGGRKLGSRPRSLIWLDRIGEQAAAGVLRSVIARARAGDMVAAGLLLHRVWPPRRGRPITLNLPPITRASDVPKALSAIATAVSHGDITTTEAAEMGTLIEAVRRSIELAELEVRVAALEERTR